ncbi:MAG: phospholipid carrier-dependent glycosyltransferase [Anaerolineae bacterium]|nr:MAG: phospholipid carrier-dependent glycosyltransferase [Anaerolineae bacterium]
MQSLNSFIKARPWVIPLVLALVFIAITLPGIEWGLPDGWNPDELVQQVVKALHGELVFDEENFDYPSLPKYAMYWVGRLVLALGHGDTQVMWAARLLSVLLGAGLVALTFALARRTGAGVYAAAFASLLVLTSSEFAQHARFAHNDIYLVFFATLTTWAALRYGQTGQRGWFYAACFAVGLTASSKYNGGALLIVPLVFYALHTRRGLWRDALRSGETLALGAVAAFGGYALGTPRALTWMTFYFKRLVPALQNHAQYGRTPDSVQGFVGQWQRLWDVLGPALFLLGLAGLAYFLWRAVQALRARDLPAAAPWLALSLATLALDLPILISYNYPARFFLPLLPLLAVMAARLVEIILETLAARGWGRARPALLLALAVVLVYSFLRVVSIGLLFANDARGPAGDFLATLPRGGIIEYTSYPPVIDRTQFDAARNYPLFFIKLPGQQVPEGKFFEYNTGAEGIADRQPTYLVIDSFIANRFNDPYTCELHPLDCAFFKALAAGETAYVEIGHFAYSLPAWLPRVPLSFLNPEIFIYQLQ